MGRIEAIQSMLVPVVAKCIELYGEEATKSALHWVLMKLYQNELQNKDGFEI